MLSEDPIGHTQSTNDKHSSEKPSQLVVGYLTCFHVLNIAVNILQELELLNARNIVETN